jgi:hypothetical protein
LGGCTELGFVKNCFGDATALRGGRPKLNRPINGFPA